MCVCVYKRVFMHVGAGEPAHRRTHTPQQAHPCLAACQGSREAPGEAAGEALSVRWFPVPSSAGLSPPPASPAVRSGRRRLTAGLPESHLPPAC